MPVLHVLILKVMHGHKCHKYASFILSAYGLIHVPGYFVVNV